MEQKIEQLTEKEKAWIASQLASAVRFVNLYRPEQGGRPVTLAALDRAFAAFLASNPKDTEIIKAIINVVGTSFGQFLVDGLGLKWVIATDDQGSELAAHRLAGQGDVLIYPANFVAKRWERREANFLQNSYNHIAEQVKMVEKGRQPEEKSKPKPWWKVW